MSEDAPLPESLSGVPPPPVAEGAPLRAPSTGNTPPPIPPVDPAGHPTAGYLPPPVYGGQPYGYPPPRPVEPWGYTALRPARPGLVTAIGVVSIIVASLSLMGSAITGLFGMSMRAMVTQTAIMARTRARANALPAPPPAKATIATNGDPDGSSGVAESASEPVDTTRGFAEGDRQLIGSLLERREELPPNGLRQIEGMLARAGQDIFPRWGASAGVGEEVRRQAILDAVRGHGSLRAADPTQPDGAYFELASGRLEIYNDRAVFRPKDASVRVVRSAVRPGGPIVPAEVAAATPVAPGGDPADAAPPAPEAGATDPFANDPEDPFAAPAGGKTPTTLPAGNTSAVAKSAPASPGALTPVQVTTIVNKVQATSGNRLNPRQIATLRSALQAPNQQLVPPAAAWSPVSLAVVGSDGSATLKLTSAYMVIDAQGQLVQQGVTSIPAMSINPWSIALVIGESVASALAAVFLLIIGILVLREYPAGRRLHLTYALIKIPLGIAGAIGLGWLLKETATAVSRLVTTPGVASGPSQEFQTIGLILAVVGLIYPLVLLIVLHVRPVRDYFRSLHQAT